nr:MULTISPECIES: serine/threonine-protein kinase [unclassified Mycobacterium]
MRGVGSLPLVSGTVFAGYTILRLLGSGGMGEVYLAQHPRLPRRDALKVLPADVSADHDYRARFNREADLASRLWHPHIVSVHDRGECDGQLWISMDYVNGLDAAQLLANRYPDGMPINQVVRIVTAIASALDYAHRQGLLHRDVKPGNIMLTHLDDDQDEQRTLLADFGIARSVEDISGLTATNMTVGTVAYAAPEQLMGEKLDGRTDQYALAATTYHLLTGRQLFQHSNPAVVISRQLNAAPPLLSDVDPRLASLDAPLQRALSKDLHARFARCQDMARALAGANIVGITDLPANDSAPTKPALMPSAKDDSVKRPATVKPLQQQSIRITALVLAILVLALLSGVILDRIWRQRSAQQPSAPVAAPAPALSTTTTLPAPTSSAITTSPSTTTAAAPTTSVAHSLPVAVVGSSCRPHSTPTVDADGATVYCARIQYTDGHVWSRIAETVPYPVPLGSANSGPPIDQQICAQQTGRSIAYCATAISLATYEGDGPTGCPPGVEACGG